MHTVAAGLAFGLGVALAALALLAGGSGAETLAVDGAGNGDFTTISAAVANATAGDIIRVWNGSYQEQVVVDVAVMLLGNGTASTVIDANLSEAAPPVDGTVVNITADGVTLRGFTVTGGRHGVVLYRADDCVVGDNNLSGNYLDGFQDSGLVLLDTSGCTLTGNRVADNQAGIRLERSHDNLVANNNVSDNRNFGLKVADSRGNTLSQNRVNNNQYNIYLERCRDTVVVGNNASFKVVNESWFIRPFLGYAIYAYATDNSTFAGNDIGSAFYGLFLEQSHNNTVTGNEGAGMWIYDIINSSNNIFSHNFIQGGFAGFMLQEASRNYFIDNRINGTGIGVWAKDSSGNVIMGNRVTNTSYGILFHNSTGNAITGNEFRNSDTAIVLMHSKDNTLDGNVYIDSKAFDVYRSEVETWPPSSYELDATVDETETESPPRDTLAAVAALAAVGSLVAPLGYLYFLRRR